MDNQFRKKDILSYDDNEKIEDSYSNLHVSTDALPQVSFPTEKLGDDKYVTSFRHLDIQSNNNNNNNQQDFFQTTFPFEGNAFPSFPFASLCIDGQETSVSQDYISMDKDGYSSGILTGAKPEKIYISNYHTQNGITDRFHESLKRKDVQMANKIQEEFLKEIIPAGKSLINCLNNDNEKFHSCSKGGILGGEKYVEGNCFIKRPVMKTNIYKSEEEALKIPGHELKACRYLANSLLKLEIDEIAMPLVYSLEYKGYKISIQSMLPIDNRTLVYGSPDGGRTVYNHMTYLDDLMQRVSKDLNLKEHTLKGKNGSVNLCTPGDLEIHFNSSNQQFYLVDPSRIFPQRHSDTWSELLRPELLQSHSKPLCSDAFTNWDQGNKQNIEEVEEAVRHLNDVLIPKFANDYKDIIFFDQSISDHLHLNGINMYYLGKIRTLFDDVSCINSKLFLDEMIARQLKKDFSVIMREVQKKSKSSEDLLLKKELVAFLNNLASKSSFWKVDLKQSLLSHFPCSLYENEKLPTFDLRDSLFSYSSMINRFLDLIGIELTSSFSIEDRLFSVEDFSDFKPIVKSFRYSFDESSQKFVVEQIKRNLF